MRLKNKQTGEIGYLRSTNWNETALIIMDKDGVQLGKYNSLAELNEEWEDYEEPKQYWYISDGGEVYGFCEYFVDLQTGEDHREIGNLFETKEEAEKAVEKLKAWKRLKDKGFRFEEQFTHIMVDEYTADKTEKEYIDDLMLLFGGEE